MGDWEEDASVAILSDFFHLAVELPQPQPIPSTHHRRAAVTVVPFASFPKQGGYTPSVDVRVFL